MKRHRFILDKEIIGTSVDITDTNVVNQISHVLRLRKGEEVVLVSRDGVETVGEIEEIHNAGVRVHILTVLEVRKHIRPDITLYIAVLKKENVEWVAQKATEVGVTRIVPIRTERTVKLNISIPRIEKIVKEASEQSGRTSVPQVLSLHTWEEALTHAKNNASNVILSTRPHIASLQSMGIRVGIFVGPEGGWSEKELEEALRIGCQERSLGDLTLRAETAAIIGTYIVCQPHNE